jgi:MoxR-like ATPase
MSKIDMEKFADSLRHSNLKEKLTALYKKQIPVFVAGPPGIGKSAQISAVLNENCDFVREERPSQWDPIDARGVPVIRRRMQEAKERLDILFAKLNFANMSKDEGEAKKIMEVLKTELASAENLLGQDKTTEIQWPHLDFLPPVGFEGSVGLFFDELNTAPPAVQNVLLQPFQATPGQPRRIGPHAIEGSHIWLVAAGNRPEDVAHVTPMGGPLRNRFHIIEVDVDKTLIQSWTSWAVNNDIHPHVVGFLNFASEAFYQAPAGDFDAFPTPRSWSEQVSPLLKEGISGISAYRGAVGLGAANNFMAYLKELRHMPDIDALLKEASKTGTITTDFSTLPLSVTYAVMVELVFRCKDDTNKISSAMTIAEHVRPEHAGVFVASLMRDEDRRVVAKAVSTPNVQKWSAKHQMLIRPSA